MADDTHVTKARVKSGVLPGVREIKRPDFTKKAADIEKIEAERVLKQGEAGSDTSDEALMAESIEAQEKATDESDQLEESAISDEPKWYVAHTYSGYENLPSSALRDECIREGAQTGIQRV